MKSSWLVALCCAMLAACAGHEDVQPRDVSDICAIYRDNPHWATLARESARKWSAPEEVKMAIIWRESSFRAEARPPRKYFLGVPTGRLSSAYGYPQAIDGTWDWYRKETGNSRAERDDFEDAIDFVGWYLDKTRAMNGVPTQDAFSQYIAYHEGHGGYRSGAWRAKPDVRRAASQVAAQAARYRAQLSRCGGAQLASR
ncbi:MAG: transglycosylase SLT domain-containing protein [Rubrimonas sp.]|uniref:transglycosylase SLT domain-containing protein n=1 Tax=Rubrimonas sp. TaxID=2036015 RepID=UPI002FDCE985